MAIPKNSNFIVVPIKENYSMFFIQNDGKDCYVYAFDGSTADSFSGELIPVVVYHFEKPLSDMPNFEILSDAFDDNGNVFLILKRKSLDDDFHVKRLVEEKFKLEDKIELLEEDIISLHKIKSDMF